MNSHKPVPMPYSPYSKRRKVFTNTDMSIIETKREDILSNFEPQAEDSLQVLDNLLSAELAFAVQAVHKGDGAFFDFEAHRLCADHHLHLEGISLALGALDDLVQHRLLVEAEAASQIADARHQKNIRDQVGATGRKLAEQIPAVNAASQIPTGGISCSRDNIRVGFLLDPDHLGDELGMVAEVGVHDDDEVAGCELQPVYVCRSETEFA